MATTPVGFSVPNCLEAMMAIEADLAELTADLTEGQFHAPSRAGGWSIGHCIEHLTLTGNAFLAKWDAALKPPAPSSNDRFFAYSWWQRRILEFAEPPYLVRTKTTKPFVPYLRRPKQETVARFLKMHGDIAARVSASQGFDASAIKVQSPFVSWIRYPLGMSFDLALAHERRHLWQARQVQRQFLQQCLESV